MNVCKSIPKKRLYAAIHMKSKVNRIIYMILQKLISKYKTPALAPR